ncbi:MAG: autotransporter domain-containing protein [Phenylobacterium sp.]|uniref:autotransporter outer membrane beta-barrel domain-containing protein n=1 Tax=Phenylobacterium sp. TaxID=1871053 RepID=UPI0025DA8FE1|nr:autotransporter outer membrane beta-barrel domain-containing protein [Phenylobacterium sp.]MBI1198818.1 autotransporter domain-containing protein [Phenylobacterium sp.]
MKRLLVSAAVLPLLQAAAAHAETKISTATTTPVATSTLASGQPDNLTIDSAGAISPTIAGAAVTVDSSNTVTNNGTISFNNVSSATGILINGGVATTVTNAGGIGLAEDYTATDTDGDGDIDGPFAQGSGRYGIRATGSAPVTGSIVNAGAITIEGNDSAAISLETQIVGSVTSSASINVTGDRTVGLRADSVTGDVEVTGGISVVGDAAVGVEVGDVGGALELQSTIAASGYRSLSRLSDTARAALDADDLLQGGAAVRITGNVGGGVLLDVPPADKDSANDDEDGDGITDSAEGTAAIVSYGAAPAIDIGSVDRATTIGAVGTGALAYGIVNRGSIGGYGVNDGVSAIGLRIGQDGGGTVKVAGGINNQGGSISARSYGSTATGVLLNAGADVPALVNSGTVGAQQIGGLSDARAILDLSGTLAFVQNSGTIAAAVTPDDGVTQTGRAIAIDLSANTSGAIVRQTVVNSDDAPLITGDVMFGSGDDRLELLAGRLTGAMRFGAGADTLVIEGGAVAIGEISDSDNRLDIDIRNGELSVTNGSPLTISSLNVGEKGVLAVTIDPAATSTRFNVAGAATLASGAQVNVTLASLSRGAQSYQIIQAGSLSVGAADATLAGAPYLYTASLRSDTGAGALYVDLTAKTAAQLGLNRSESQAYSAVFDSLDKNPDIEAAFLAQSDKTGFQSLYDQMLPDHSGGVLMSAAAVSQAVSKAAATPLRIDASSGTGTWAQEIVFSLQQDRQDALGFKSQGFGFAAGADLQGEDMALGANVSFVSADVKDRGAAAGEQVTMNLLGAGLYWRLDGGPLQATARGGVGYAFMKGDRRLIATDLDIRAKADWGAWMVDGYAGVSYEARLGSLYARPELSLSYVRLAEDGYHESGGGSGFDLTVDKRTGDLLTGEALLAVGWRFGDEVYFAPEIKAGYRARIAGGPGGTTAHFDGGSDFTLDAEDVAKGGAVLRAGVRGGAAKVLYALDGGATVDSGYREYDVRAVVRFQF